MANQVRRQRERHRVLGRGSWLWPHHRGWRRARAGASRSCMANLVLTPQGSIRCCSARAPPRITSGSQEARRGVKLDNRVRRRNHRSHHRSHRLGAQCVGRRHGCMTGADVAAPFAGREMAGDVGEGQTHLALVCILSAISRPGHRNVVDRVGSQAGLWVGGPRRAFGGRGGT